MMAAQGGRFEATAIDGFGEKLTAWANRLDPTSAAMLVDLLARAGGDVAGVDAEPDTGRLGDDPSSDVQAPLQLGDYAAAVRGILQNAPQLSKGGA
jgi:hypothetical protein